MVKLYGLGLSTIDKVYGFNFNFYG